MTEHLYSFNTSNPQEVKDFSENVVIAIDIETTGKGETDKIIAVGFSCYKTNPAPNSTTYTQPAVQCVLSNITIAQDLGFPNLNDMTGEKWKALGYEKDCWERFWKNKVPTLERLQSSLFVEDLCPNEREFATKINSVLAEFEVLAPRSFILCDTTLYDTVWLGGLLSKYGFEPLNYDRNGKYREGIELDSVVRALMLRGHDVSWTDLANFKKDKLEPLVRYMITHDHDPSQDAANHLMTYFAALRYMEKKRKSEYILNVVLAIFGILVACFYWGSSIINK